MTKDQKHFTKERIFSATYDAWCEFKEIADNRGIFDKAAQRAYGGYMALFGLIEEAGFEDELESWMLTHGLKYAQLINSKPVQKLREKKRRIQCLESEIEKTQNQHTLI